MNSRKMRIYHPFVKGTRTEAMAEEEWIICLCWFLTITTAKYDDDGVLPDGS